MTDEEYQEIYEKNAEKVAHYGFRFFRFVLTCYVLASGAAILYFIVTVLYHLIRFLFF